LFAVVFTIVAALQYLFIRHEIRYTVSEQLEHRADKLLTIMDPNSHLDLAALRRVPAQSSRFVILASDGTFIDMHDFVRGTVSYADPPAGISYEQPSLVKSSLGEEWHLLARKVKGGLVVVGASTSNSTPDINTRLLETAKQFGDSVGSAMGPVPIEDADVNFAVLADDGILLEDHGGIPLKVRKTKTPLLFKRDGPILTIAGTPFFIHKVPVIDQTKHQRGTIAVLTDFALEQETLRDALMFNVAVAVACLLLCGLVIVIELQRRGSPTTQSGTST